jgi:hypothetical protein
MELISQKMGGMILRDAQYVSQDTQTWMSSILQEYATQRTVFIREEAIDEIASLDFQEKNEVLN